jgi:hypothetical protein
MEKCLESSCSWIVAPLAAWQIFGMAPLAQAAGEHPMIKIVSAFYRSSEGSSVNVAKQIKKLCEGLPGCAFRVFDSAMGNVANPPGIGRYLTVDWRCGDKPMPAYRQDEIQAASLACY